MELSWLGYGSLVLANNYFSMRLNTFNWDQASADDRIRANNEAFEASNRFNYVGQKFVVQQALNADADATEATLRAADLTQVGEFPRGDSTVVPDEVRWAQYLWSLALLSGRVPEDDFENLAVTSQAYGGVRQSYNRDISMDHLALLIPSPAAFNYLRPWFRDDWGFALVKV